MIVILYVPIPIAPDSYGDGIDRELYNYKLKKTISIPALKIV